MPVPRFEPRPGSHTRFAHGKLLWSKYFNTMVELSPILNTPPFRLSFFKKYPAYQKRFPKLALTPIDNLGDSMHLKQQVGLYMSFWSATIGKLREPLALVVMFKQLGRTHLTAQVTQQEFNVSDMLALLHVALALGSLRVAVEHH